MYRLETWSIGPSIDPSKRLTNLKSSPEKSGVLWPQHKQNGHVLEHFWHIGYATYDIWQSNLWKIFMIGMHHHQFVILTWFHWKISWQWKKSQLDSEIFHLTVKKIIDSEKSHFRIIHCQVIFFTVKWHFSLSVTFFTVSDIFHCQMMTFFTVK